ncbi:MAG TPA: hypothetical protein VK673_20345 [Chthoniobacterales bacterium]|nr:hypothetical protein [Chthoniobacterales bacterium]
MREAVSQLNSAYLDNRRPIWICEPENVSGASDLVVFLDGAILEEDSRHIAIGLEYLPAIARRLHHSRELHEPFDFLTWFEYAPEHSAAFEEVVSRLRNTKEWEYVDREIDIRLVRS